MCRNTVTFHSHGDIILLCLHSLISFKKSEDIIIFLKSVFTGVKKLTLKRDNGLYNLYVMYLMKDAKSYNSAILNKRTDSSFISKTI